MLTGGGVTPFVGSWRCRRDGKLVVTLLDAVYGTTTDAVNHPTTVPNPPPVDLFLISNQRFTYLFNVNDDNSITRIQFRKRVYLPSEDPSNPAGGTLSPLNSNEVVYKRVVASDADLLAP
jgi:hypothetical protein